MKKLLFATNNQHKVKEVKHLVGHLYQVQSLAEAGINIDIPEPHNTLEENAREKSLTIYKLTGTDCFSEDTGLETAALNGEPGVLSARYAGDGNNAEANIDKLLQKLALHTNRAARFRAVISLVLNGKEYQFKGECKGSITKERMGSQGFGYDPVFIPEGADKTFGEMTLEEKSRFNHRQKAVAKLVAFLSQKRIFNP